MKRNILIIFSLMLLFTGCSDYLQETNKSGLTSELYSTESGMEALVNSCYTTMRYWYGKEGGLSLTELGTDLFIIGGDCKHPEYSLYNSSLNPSQALMKIYWERFYVGLNNCNTAIDWLENRSPLDEATTKIRLGEVKFLRAFYLWHIVNIWGGVHLSTTPSEGVITTANKTSVSAFYTQILADLDDAITDLEGRIEKDGGRITKPAAEAFMARAYLYNGDKEKAATLAKHVIKDYGFAMFTDYKSVWSMDYADGDANSEVVFYVNYSNNQLYGKTGMANDGDREISSAHAFSTDGGHNAHFYFGPRHDYHAGVTAFTTQYPIGYSRYATTRHLIDLFDETKDQRYRGSFRDVWMQNDGEAGLAKVKAAGVYTDMQLGDTAWCIDKHVATAAQRAYAAKRYQLQDINDIYNEDGSLKSTQNFIQMDKFDDPTRAAAFQIWSPRDAFVIRISEMYLIVAEAEMESNPGEALEYMNLLRRQRAIAGKENEMEITASDLTLDFILAERARELVGEQQRWFDLKRTGKLLEYVKAYNPNGRGNIKDYHLYRPIPQTQIDAVTNKDEFTQNDGYNN
ncbi:RagB/SusD family nutrient uptake outer membrane protein [uncultured Bacteroides sp.]|uniref:RagB/SusD family nutrient uptake outer membrane protein n=1 Tax=uncultured Bacteroides sp. TaxID=162156 RepID=UPI002AABB783|nr:RagB/SusD family nutrient uptake outer membrane protein [uncultured Bacteroides sp.]